MLLGIQNDPAIQSHLTNAEGIAGQDNFPGCAALTLASTAKDAAGLLCCSAVSQMTGPKAVLLHRAVMKNYKLLQFVWIIEEQKF